jgi:hypothetical protein
MASRPSLYDVVSKAVNFRFHVRLEISYQLNHCQIPKVDSGR